MSNHDTQQTDDGPDVTRLTTERTAMVRPTHVARWYRIDDDWTTKRPGTLNQEWTGSTNFEETTAYKDEYITDDVEEQQEARKAKGLQYHSNQQHKRDSNTSSHTYHTGAGALYAYKQRVGQTTAQNRKTNHQRFTAPSPTTRQSMSKQHHQFSQP